MMLSVMDLPESLPKMPLMEETEFRSAYILNTHILLNGKPIPSGSYVFVARNWVQLLARWLRQWKVLEIMSGTGLLAAALQAEGVDVIATDDFSWRWKPELRGWQVDHTHVEELTARDAVLKYGKERPVLLCSWPPMTDEFTEAALLHRSLRDDALVVYIGEGEKGCTANDRFFAHFQQIDVPEIQEVNKVYPRFRGIHDFVQVGYMSLR